MKYRIKITCEDYYDYVGTGKSYYSFKNRVESAIPSCINQYKPYNIKAKVVKELWDCHRWYRISLSIKMEELEFQNFRESIQHYMETCCHGVKNFSWHQIKKGRCTDY